MFIKKFKEESGQAMVLFALAFVVICGFAAYAVDLGSLAQEKSDLQNVADAAALAGAQELPDVDKAKAVAIEYAAINGETEDIVVTPLVSDDKLHITVEIKRNVKGYFTNVIGAGGSKDVGAKAIASVSEQKEEVKTIKETTEDSGKPADGVSGVMPLAIEKKTLEFGTDYTLKEGSDKAIYTGNYGGLALGGEGESTFELNLEKGYKGKLNVGDEIFTKTGNMASANEAIINRINKDPDATYLTVKDNSPRLITVVIVESLKVTGKKEVKIVGFAQFFLEKSEGKGGKYEITGKFLKKIIPDSTIGSGTDYGGHAPKTTTTEVTTYKTKYTLPQLTE